MSEPNKITKKQSEKKNVNNFFRRRKKLMIMFKDILEQHPDTSISLFMLSSKNNLYEYSVGKEGFKLVHNSMREKIKDKFKQNNLVNQNKI